MSSTLHCPLPSMATRKPLSSSQPVIMQGIETTIDLTRKGLEVATCQCILKWQSFRIIIWRMLRHQVILTVENRVPHLARREVAQAKRLE